MSPLTSLRHSRLLQYLPYLMDSSLLVVLRSFCTFAYLCRHSSLVRYFNDIRTSDDGSPRQEAEALLHTHCDYYTTDEKNVAVE